MRSKTWHIFLYGQIWLYAWLIIAILLRPSGLIANSGVSFYGIYLSTVIPYSIALLGAAYWNWHCADELTEPVWLSQSLRLISLCLIGISLTPYSLGLIFDDAHTTIGALLFIVQLVTSARIAFLLHRRLITVLLWFIELTAGIVSAIYVLSDHGYLLQSQVVFQLAFASIILLVLPYLDHTKKPSQDRSLI